MREVSNEEFAEANNNEEYQKIAQQACRTYYNIPQDERERCKMMALWKTLGAFDKKRNGKFTSLLYQRVIWECLSYLKSQEGTPKPTEYIEVVVDSGVPVSDLWDEVGSIPEKYSVVVRQRYSQNMSFREIAVENDYSKETARRYFKKGMECLKNKAQT